MRYQRKEIQDKIISYEKIFDFGGAACATLKKLKIINEFIQIERPKHLLKYDILTIINLLMNTEKYIAIKNLKQGGNLSYKIKKDNF